MLQSAYNQLSQLQAELAADNSPSLQVVPTVYTSQIYALRPHELIETILLQVDHLKEKCGADQIVILENEFRSSKRYIPKGPSVQQERW